MKIAVAGKGGVGKTTVCGLLARLLDERQYRVLAVNADPDANLASMLPIDHSRPLIPLAARESLLRQLAGQNDQQPSGLILLNPDVGATLHELQAPWGNGQGLLTLGWHKQGGTGCYCLENAVLRRVLDTALTQERDVVLVNSEAGLEHLSRGTPKSCDALLVVVEPGQRSIATAHDVRRLAGELGIFEVFPVLSGYRNAAEIAFAEQALAPWPLLAALPFAEELRRADLAGEPPGLTDALRQAIAPILNHLVPGRTAMSQPVIPIVPVPEKKQRARYPSKKDVLEQTPDPGVKAMLLHLEEQGIQTPFDRFDAQGAQCGHGLAGTCCRICNMGPCTINKRSPRGVCGADEHVIVARNILRWVAAAVASHGARSREVMLTLKGAADGRLDLPIKGEAKVLAVARAFGLNTEERRLPEVAGEIADILLEDLSRTTPAAHRTLAAMVPPERLALWKSLDILPISAYHEVFEAYHRTGVGTDGDWRNLMQQLLRCGLAFAWSSVAGGSIAQDILYGPPQRSRIDAGFGALEPDYVNIALHGHSPVLPSAIVHAGDLPELKALAESKGARGIRFYGICCSGLSSLYRYGAVSPLANAVGAELVLGTGALDAWVADVQDVYPGIMEVAKCFHTKVITTSDSCRLPGALHIAFDHEHSNLAEAQKMAEEIVRIGIENFPLRRKANVFIPRTSVEAEIGFSIENILPEFGGAAGLAGHLRDGTIRGIVNLVGCNNPKVLYEKAIAQVTDILLANDIIVLTNGCASFPLLKLGYCQQSAADKTSPPLRALLEEKSLPPVWHMGECLDNARASGLFRVLADTLGRPLKEMPFAFSSPEWSNEKGVGASLGFRLLGLDSYHCIPAPIGGSQRVQDFFEQDTTELLGGRMVINTDPVALGNSIVADLEQRWQRLFH